MTIYLVFLAFIMIFGFTKNWNASNVRKKRFLIVSFGLIILIASLRKYTVGIDLERQYYDAYSKIADLKWSDWSSLRYEWGYFAFNKLLSYLSDDPQFFVFSSSLFVFSAVAYFIYKNSEDVVMSTVLFVTFNMFFMYMNIIRQAIAIAIILFGFEQIKRKHYIKFILFVVVASLVHNSAWMALLFIPMSILPFKKKEIIISVIAYLASLFAVNSIFSYVIRYFESSDYYNYQSNKFRIGYSNWYSSLTILMLIAAFIFAYYVLVWKGRYSLDINDQEKNTSFKRKSLRINRIKIVRNKYNGGDVYIERNLLLYGTLFSLLFQACVISVNILTRFRHYFFIILLISIPAAIGRTSNTNRKMISAIVYVIFICYFILVGFIMANSQFGTVPYKFFWE